MEVIWKSHYGKDTVRFRRNERCRKNCSALTSSDHGTESDLPYMETSESGGQRIECLYETNHKSYDKFTGQERKCKVEQFQQDSSTQQSAFINLVKRDAWKDWGSREATWYHMKLLMLMIAW